MLCMSISHDKILGCFLLGACGDALGAPIETTGLPEIKARYGQNGLDHMIAHINAFGQGVDYPVGDITDDTAMSMTVLSALRKTLQQKPVTSNEFEEKLRQNLWQAYLQWGQHQDNSPEIAAKIDKNIPWPDDVKNFWFERGAGRGTIAALCQDYPGSFERPQVYEMNIRGKETKSPNAGCGGMMRIAPIAFLPLSEDKIFDIACQTAVITNGHPDAYVAAGVTALIIRHAAQGLSIQNSLEKISDLLQRFSLHPYFAQGVPASLRAIEIAQDGFQKNPNSLDHIDALPKNLGYANPFQAVPVLAQVIYAALHAEESKDTKAAMIIAVNHGGDSDSVGAIVGNILGSKHGLSAIPREWLETLRQKEDVALMAQSLADTLNPKQHTLSSKPPQP